MASTTTNLTADHLRAIMPNAPEGDIEDELELCIDTAIQFDIRTKARFAAWIANVAKESGELHYVEELADGWAYEWRADLGNTQAGDGPRYKGHGYIQITGRHNHKVVGEALGVDAIAKPKILTEVKYAWLSAGYYWRYMSSWGDLNEFADYGDFESTVLGVRGGPDPDRRHYYDTALEVLPADLDIGGENPPAPPIPAPIPEEYPTDIAKATESGYLYIESSNKWLKMPALLSGDLKTDSEGWVYLPGVAPVPEPVQWEWPVANDAPWSSGYYWQIYPTRYNWLPERPDVEKIARKLVDDNPGLVWCNTYYHHPPELYPPSYEKDSFDVWAYAGRGTAIDPAVGQRIFDQLFNDPAKPDIRHIIWNGWLWHYQGGWQWYGDHYDHLHVTYLA